MLLGKFDFISERLLALREANPSDKNVIRACGYALRRTIHP